MSGSAAALAARVTIDRHLEDGEGHRALAEDALDGLTRPFKELPPKHFYDARGSELFEQICALPEYYPTRTEMGILEAKPRPDDMDWLPEPLYVENLTAVKQGELEIAQKLFAAR